MPKRKRYRKSNNKADRALKIATKLKREIDGEKKIRDVEQTYVGVPVAPLLVLLSDVNQGDTHAQRDGDRIKAWTNHFKGILKWSATSTWAVTIGIIIKKNNSITAPTINTTAATDLLESPANATLKVLASNSWHNRASYKVLWKHTFPANTDSTDAIYLDKFNRLGHRILYNSATAANNDMQGNLWFFAYSDATDNYPTIEFYNRFKFVDN